MQKPKRQVRGKKRRIRKNKITMIGGICALTIIILLLTVLQYHDIPPINNDTDENAYIMAQAICRGEETVTINCPEDVDTSEEIRAYFWKIYVQARECSGFAVPLSCVHYTDNTLKITNGLAGVTKEDVDALYDNETAKVRELAGEDLAAMTDQQKVALIIKYITDNYQYGDREDGTKYDIITSLTESKEMVCDGYSTLFYAICQRMNLDCVILGSDIHAWNAVRFDGNDYYTIVDLANSPFAGYTGVLMCAERMIHGGYSCSNGGCRSVTTRPASPLHMIDQIIINIKY